jgi:hypothetical protein
LKTNDEVSSPLPVKKKAKKETSLIMSYFNKTKQLDENNDKQKENNSRRRSKPTISIKTESNKLTNQTNITKRRSKTKQEESPLITPETHLLSSVQIEKTSLILFDEVCSLRNQNVINFHFSLDRNINNR